MVNVWPWKITRLLAQIYSAPFLAYGLSSLMLSRRQTWPEVRVVVMATFVFAFGVLLASFIHRELFSLHQFGHRIMVWRLFAGDSHARIANHTRHLGRRFSMIKSPTRLYTAFSGIFLLLQGTSTLAFRLIPSLDETFPALLSTTRMIPLHSTLHILTGIVALIVLLRGEERSSFWFAAGFRAFYTSLAFFGIITHHPTILGLQPFDHPFHFVLGMLGLLAAGLHIYRSQRRKKAAL